MDRAALVDLLVALSSVGETEPAVVSIDLNPIIIEAGTPIAVDALVEIT